MPDFLENIEFVDVLLEDVVVDTSNVNMNVIGDYVVTYSLPSGDDEAVTYDITVHVVGYPTTQEPILFGVKDLEYIIGEERTDLMKSITAVDKEYGDITHRILITEDISWSTPGVYDVRYQVENIDGYTAFEIATIEVMYDDANLTLPSEFIIVEQDNLYGLKTKTGGNLLPLEYDRITYVGESVLRLEKDDLSFYYNSDAKEFIQYDYELMSPFIDGLAIVNISYDSSMMLLGFGGYEEDNEYFSYMNPAGEVVMPFIYSDVSPFIDGLAIVEMGRNYGVIDKNGNQVIESMYDDIEYFIGDTFIKELEGKYEVVEFDDELVIEVSEDWYQTYFNEDDEAINYLIRIDGKEVLIDRDFNIIFQTDYAHLDLHPSFPNLVFSYNDDGPATLYNLESDLIIEGITDIELLEEDLLFKTSDGWGILDLHLGVVGVEPNYASLEQMVGKDNLYIAENEDGMFGVITNLDHVQFDFEATYIQNNEAWQMFKDGFYRYTDDEYYYG